MRVSGCLVSVVVGLLAVTSPADVVFSTYGSDNSVCTTCNWWNTGFHPSEPPYYRGMPFTVPPASSYKLTRIRLTVFNGQAGTSPKLYVALNADDNGLPGAMLEQFTFTNFADSNFSNFVSLPANSVRTPTLSAGRRYWLTTAVSSPSSMVVGWMMNNQGASGMTAWHAGPTTSWQLIPSQSLAAFSIEGTATPANSCPIAQPALPTDSIAQQLEAAAKGRSLNDCAAAAFTLVPPYVNEQLDSAINALIAATSSATIRRVAGYRSRPYQQHFYDVKTAHADLYLLALRDPEAAQQCASLDSWIKAEIDKHCLSYQTTGPYLSVNPPESSAHTVCAEPVSRDPCLRPSARAVDLEIVPKAMENAVAARLATHGLALCGSDKAFHVQLVSDGNCVVKQVVRASVLPNASAAAFTTDANSGAVVRILVTDDIGRRVGFDPVSGADVNEFPEGTATYSGGETANAEIIIAGQGDRVYQLTAVGVVSGDYRLVLQSLGADHGDVIQEHILTGTAAPGVATPPATIVVNEVTPPTTLPPLRHRAAKH